MAETANPKPKINPDIFHSHLDNCKQCRENPMNLCQIGQVSLANATGHAPDLNEIFAPRILDLEHPPEEARLMRKVADQVFGKGFSDLLNL